MVSSTDVQRLFLQAVFSRGIISGKLAQILWAKCIDAVKAANDTLDIPHSDERAAWDNFVAKVNTSIDSLDLEFRHLHDEVTGREMYALVNRKGDEVAQMATDYTPTEIAYFKAIVEQIMLAPNESYSLSSLAALREVNALRQKSGMTKTQAEVVLSSFVAKGWLLKSKRGRYSLSTRTLLELLPYLKSTYPDEIIECTICMEIITRGIACQTPNCKTRMHYHCFTTYRRRHGTCPSCNTDWPREAHDKPLVPVGEDAMKDGQDGKRRVRVQSAEPSDEDEDELMEEDEPSQATQPKTQPRTQRTQRSRKTKGKANDATMDVDDDDDNEGEEDNSPPKKSQANGKRRTSGRR